MASKRNKDYKQINNALCVVIHTIDGKNIADSVLKEFEEAAAKFAKDKGLLVNITHT
jgi:hypothetical protein